MTIVLGIHGKPKAGKDTTANFFIKKYSLMREGPSVYVKNTTAAMFRVPRDYLDNEQMKDVIDPFWNMSYREMCQKVGKESSRDIFGDDIWLRNVEITLNQIKTGVHLYDTQWSGIVLADIRYENEIHWVKQQGGKVIIIIRNDAARGYVANENHPAEKGLDPSLADILIENNGTVEELYSKLENIEL